MFMNPMRLFSRPVDTRMFSSRWRASSIPESHAFCQPYHLRWRIASTSEVVRCSFVSVIALRLRSRRSKYRTMMALNPCPTRIVSTPIRHGQPMIFQMSAIERMTVRGVFTSRGTSQNLYMSDGRTQAIKFPTPLRYLIAVVSVYGVSFLRGTRVPSQYRIRFKIFPFDAVVLLAISSGSLRTSPLSVMASLRESVF